MLACQWHLDIPYGKQAEAPWPCIIPGSQHRVVYRVLEAPAG